MVYNRYLELCCKEGWARIHRAGRDRDQVVQLSDVHMRILNTGRGFQKLTSKCRDHTENYLSLLISASPFLPLKVRGLLCLPFLDKLAGKAPASRVRYIESATSSWPWEVVPRICSSAVGVCLPQGPRESLRSGTAFPGCLTSLFFPFLPQDRLPPAQWGQQPHLGRA